MMYYEAQRGLHKQGYNPCKNDTELSPVDYLIILIELEKKKKISF